MELNGSNTMNKREDRVECDNCSSTQETVTLLRGKEDHGDSQEDGVQRQEDERTPAPLIRGLSEIARELYVDGEAACGLGSLRGEFLQRFANKNTYVILYGVLGCVMGACSPYLTGIISTLEKRYQIPSTKSGIIMVGYDISTLALCLLLNYYGSRGHRPRWVAVGVYVTVGFCLLSALPQLLYGAGDGALGLTLEYAGHSSNATNTMSGFDNVSRGIQQPLCMPGEEAAGGCENTSENMAPLVILFSAQLLGGIGGSLFYTLGVAYMDDNIQRSKAPALISFSFFLRMLGPPLGFTLASASLSIYISPGLTPTIDNQDPRWLGAWWLGWLVLAIVLAVIAVPMLLFPKDLPRAAARRIQATERREAGFITHNDIPVQPEIPASLKDMMLVFKRLMKNKTLVFNNFASIFYLLGYIPFWVYMTKYIEIMYKMSASSANFITGVLGLTFSAIGVLMSGVVMSRYKPRARSLSAYNTSVSLITMIGIITYAFLGCPVNDTQGVILASGQLETVTECNADCNCDFVKYSPVCSADGRTFISACHAGCKDYRTLTSGGKVFTNCSCIQPPPELPQEASEGPCPVNCTIPFYIFLTIVCFNKFLGASGRTSSFLVSVRCVEEKDKTMAMALGMVLVSTFAFLPSPIFFGYIIDTTCLVWGKTCTGTGNCWVYNPKLLRYLFNFTSAGFFAIGTMFDVAVWFTVKNLKIFDDEVEATPPQSTSTELNER